MKIVNLKSEFYRYSLLAIVLLTVCVTGCERRLMESKFLMGTTVDITTIGSRRDCQRATGLAFDEIKRIHKLMNVYDSESEIARINQAAGKSPAVVSADTLQVIESSLRYARLTDGALDITVAPLMELWGFGNGSERVPPDDELREALSLVDYKKVTVDRDRSAVMLGLTGMRIDLSAIAKGYAVDKAIQALKDAGIQNALVNAGGDIYAMGSPPGKKFWRIGVRHPRNNADLLGIVELRDRAIATSGDYENFFEVDGKRYCHIMDTRTGRPVVSIMSVTIVADNTSEADALATAVFPLGAEKGMELIESLEDVDGIIVTGEKEDDMKVIASSGMKGMISWTKAVNSELKLIK